MGKLEEKTAVTWAQWPLIMRKLKANGRCFSCFHLGNIQDMWVRWRTVTFQLRIAMEVLYRFFLVLTNAVILHPIFVSKAVVTTSNTATPMLWHWWYGTNHTTEASAQTPHSSGVGKIIVAWINIAFRPQRTIGALQSHILSFTQRLHAAEVDRRSLRLELSKSKQETAEVKSAQSSAESQFRKTKDDARGLEEKVQELKEEVGYLWQGSRGNNYW